MREGAEYVTCRHLGGLIHQMKLFFSSFLRFMESWGEEGPRRSGNFKLGTNFKVLGPISQHPKFWDVFIFGQHVAVALKD